MSNYASASNDKKKVRDPELDKKRAVLLEKQFDFGWGTQDDRNAERKDNDQD